MSGSLFLDLLRTYLKPPHFNEPPPTVVRPRGPYRVAPPVNHPSSTYTDWVSDIIHHLVQASHRKSQTYILLKITQIVFKMREATTQKEIQLSMGVRDDILFSPQVAVFDLGSVDRVEILLHGNIEYQEIGPTLRHEKTPSIWHLKSVSRRSDENWVLQGDLKHVIKRGDPIVLAYQQTYAFGSPDLVHLLPGWVPRKLRTKAMQFQKQAFPAMLDDVIPVTVHKSEFTIRDTEEHQFTCVKVTLACSPEEYQANPQTFVVNATRPHSVRLNHWSFFQFPPLFVRKVHVKPTSVKCRLYSEFSELPIARSLWTPWVKTTDRLPFLFTPLDPVRTGPEISAPAPERKPTADPAEYILVYSGYSDPLVCHDIIQRWTIVVDWLMRVFPALHLRILDRQPGSLHVTPWLHGAEEEEAQMIQVQCSVQEECTWPALEKAMDEVYEHYEKRLWTVCLPDHSDSYESYLMLAKDLHGKLHVKGSKGVMRGRTLQKFRQGCMTGQGEMDRYLLKPFQGDCRQYLSENEMQTRTGADREFVTRRQCLNQVRQYMDRTKVQTFAWSHTSRTSTFDPAVTTAETCLKEMLFFAQNLSNEKDQTIVGRLTYQIKPTHQMYTVRVWSSDVIRIYAHYFPQLTYAYQTFPDRSFLPAPEPVRRSTILVHGLTNHAVDVARFESVAQQFKTNKKLRLTSVVPTDVHVGSLPLFDAVYLDFGTLTVRSLSAAYPLSFWKTQLYGKWRRQNWTSLTTPVYICGVTHDELKEYAKDLQMELNLQLHIVESTDEPAKAWWVGCQAYEEQRSGAEIKKSCFYLQYPTLLELKLQPQALVHFCITAQPIPETPDKQARIEQRDLEKKAQVAATEKRRQERKEAKERAAKEQAEKDQQDLVAAQARKEKEKQERVATKAQKEKEQKEQKEKRAKEKAEKKKNPLIKSKKKSPVVVDDDANDAEATDTDIEDTDREEETEDADKEEEEEDRQEVLVMIWPMIYAVPGSWIPDPADLSNHAETRRLQRACVQNAYRIAALKRYHEAKNPTQDFFILTSSHQQTGFDHSPAEASDHHIPGCLYTPTESLVEKQPQVHATLWKERVNAWIRRRQADGLSIHITTLYVDHEAMDVHPNQPEGEATAFWQVALPFLVVRQMVDHTTAILIPNPPSRSLLDQRKKWTPILDEVEECTLTHHPLFMSTEHMRATHDIESAYLGATFAENQIHEPEPNLIFDRWRKRALVAPPIAPHVYFLRCRVSEQE